MSDSLFTRDLVNTHKSTAATIGYRPPAIDIGGRIFFSAKDVAFFAEHYKKMTGNPYDMASIPTANYMGQIYYHSADLSGFLSAFAAAKSKSFS